MYSTCLFCNKSLGANEAIEAFPVGKRLAFDSAKGRLWAVCPHCERWNLSPLDERWEAIEQAERLYRDTRTRVATDNVGLAKIREGTTLVRIGEPLRPEFAAWRYGDQFGRRRNRQMLIAGAGLAALGGVVVGGAVIGGGVGGFFYGITKVGQSIVRGRPQQVVAKIATDGHGIVQVRRRHLAESTLYRASDGGLGLTLRFKNGSADFEGREAERVAAIVIPKVNRFGGSKRAVNDAVAAIEQDGGPERYLDGLSRTAHAWTLPRPDGKGRGWGRFAREDHSQDYGLYGLPTAHRLALEMSLHEEAERRALHGELAELEAAWRSAEEIAGIADSLLVAPEVDSQLHRLKGDA
jgi:hypothetical protein